MKTVIVSFMVLLSVVRYSEELQDLIGTDKHKCIECLCHARTGCYRRKTCASYSISYNYWQTAGYPTLPNDDPNDISSYTKCMNDENCILNTIVGYTETFNSLDCNCDGVYDCQDMLKLHLYDEQCGNVMNQQQANRYNNCAVKNKLSRMTSTGFCEVEAQ